jgi:hypothetical protein
MTESKEPLKIENGEVYEEFPFPKLIKSFDFFFPKQKGYKSIDWRKKLKIWSLWAPWVTIASLFVILCFIGMNDPDMRGQKVVWIAFFLLFLSFVKALYHFGVAIVAKCLKRSPVVALSLAPVTALWSVGILCVLQIMQILLFGGEEPTKKALIEKPYALQKTCKKDQGDSITHQHMCPIKQGSLKK